MNLRPIIGDAVYYWERQRIVYNFVLAILVIAIWGADIFTAGPTQWLGAGLVLLTLAGIANALYCAAYPIDLAFQISPFKTQWRQSRWILFSAGLIVASSLAVWVMLSPGMA